jgi:uncharacterized protein (TIGR02001 family)
MRRFVVSASLVLANLVVAGPALSADGLRASAGLTTEYLHRGISQSDGHGALQGSLVYWHPSGPYVGVWASSIDTASDAFYPVTASASADLEVDLFAGYARRLGADWVLDLKTVAYGYPNDPAPVSYDYLEFSAGVAWRERLFATAAFTPSTTWLARTPVRRNRAALDAELSMRQPLNDWVTWMIGVGYRELDAPGPTGYVYGSTSLALQLRRVSLELGHHRVDHNADALFGTRLAGRHTVFTATVSF